MRASWSSLSLRDWNVHTHRTTLLARSDGATSRERAFGEDVLTTCIFNASERLAKLLDVSLEILDLSPEESSTPVLHLLTS